MTARVVTALNVTRILQTNQIIPPARIVTALNIFRTLSTVGTVTVVRCMTPGATGADGAGLTWSTVTSDFTMSADHGYINDKTGSRLVATLPTSCPAGKELALAGSSNDGWQINQNAGQTCHFDGGNSTTTGTGGSLSSNSPKQFCRLLCIVADTDFKIVSFDGITLS